MSDDLNDYDDEDETGFAFSGKIWTIIMLGIALVFVGFVVIVLASVFLGGGSVGGIIFIGPIPIVFGSGPNLPWLIAISLAISVISIIAFIILNRRR